MIWVFEDDADHLELMRLYCAAAGINEPFRAFRGDQDAFNTRQEPGVPPRLAIVDSNLVGIDGVTVIRRLRAAFSDMLPIIFYSSTPLEREQADALRAGADRVVVKNFGADGLPEVVRHLLAGGRTRPPPAS